MRNKKLIRLTESDLHRIVKESVNKVLMEHTYGLESNYRYKGYRMTKGGSVIDQKGNVIGKVNNPDEFGELVDSHLEKRADDIENGIEPIRRLTPPDTSYGTMADDGDRLRYIAATDLRSQARDYRHRVKQIDGI